MTEKETIGHVTVGYGKSFQRKIEIENRMRCEFADNRVAMVCKLVNDEGYVISIENIASSGRCTENNMWLSEISFRAICATLGMYQVASDVPMKTSMESLMVSEHIHYQIEGSLKDPFKK